MKITHADGSITQTDDLPDSTALVMEKVKELLDLCEAHKVPLMVRFSTHEGAHSGAHCALHPTKDPAKVVIELVNDWCEMIERFWPDCSVMIVHGKPPSDIVEKMDEPPPPELT